MIKSNDCVSSFLTISDRKKSKKKDYSKLDLAYFYTFMLITDVMQKKHRENRDGTQRKQRHSNKISVLSVSLLCFLCVKKIILYL
jgi:hypothetical protein